MRGSLRPGTAGASFSFLFEMVFEQRFRQEVEQVDDVIVGGRGQVILEASEFAQCRHPANGVLPLMMCVISGDGFLTGPGLSADEILASTSPGRDDVVALCLTGDAPPVGTASALAAIARADLGDLTIIDAANLAR